MCACPMTLFELPFEGFPTSTDNLWRPLGREVVIVGGSAFDFSLTATRVSGNARAIPAVALITARPEKPDAPVASGSYTSSQATTHNTYDLSGVTDKFLAQLGVILNLSSGTTPGYLSGILRADIAQCHQMIGRRRIEVSGQQDNGNPNFYIIGRVPASSAANLRAGLVIDNATDLEYRWYVRGINDPDDPGSWVSLGTWTTVTNGNTAVCHADTSVSGVTPTSYHRLEFAIAIRLKSGGSAPTGSLAVAAGLSYS